MAIEAVRNRFESTDMALGSAFTSASSIIGSIPGAVKRRLRDCCSTDSKVHGLVVLGRMLQVAAVLGIGASIVGSVMAGPMVLVGIIPAIAIAFLGTYMEAYSIDVHDAIFPLPSYAPGQPIGLINSGNNCWANASMQLLLNSPNLLASPAAQRIPEVQQIARAYAVARGAQERVVRGVNGQLIRNALQTVGRAPLGSVQEDAAKVFEYLFEDPHSLYQLQMTIAGAPAHRPRAEHMLCFELGQNSRQPFNILMFNYFNYQDDLGRVINLQFPTAPNDLLIQFKRFYQHRNATANQTIFRKNGDRIPAPSNFALGEWYSQDAQGANYECDGFIIHIGASLSLGHYVAFIKDPDDTWWICNDRYVRPITLEYAQMRMSEGYIYHYRKVLANA